jgi:hypothetical protein
VPIHFSTQYVLLTGTEGQTITKTVEITAELEKPLALEVHKENLQGKLIYEIEEVEQGRKFQIHFSSVPGAPGTYRGYLKLKTNYREKPEVTIRVRGRFKKG